MTRVSYTLRIDVNHFLAQAHEAGLPTPGVLGFILFFLATFLIPPSLTALIGLLPFKLLLLFISVLIGAGAGVGVAVTLALVDSFSFSFSFCAAAAKVLSCWSFNCLDVEESLRAPGSPMRGFSSMYSLPQRTASWKEVAMARSSLPCCCVSFVPADVCEVWDAGSGTGEFAREVLVDSRAVRHLGLEVEIGG
jgi:hypothetical protein